MPRLLSPSTESINREENIAVQNPRGETRAKGDFAPRISCGHFCPRMLFIIALHKLSEKGTSRSLQVLGGAK